MAFGPITDADREGKGNVGQPDTPALTTTEMQEQMDSLPNLVIDKFNELIEALEDTTAAISIGAEVPEGFTAQPNVQSILSAMVTSINLCTQAKHTHSNKAELDQISEETLTATSRLVTLFTQIFSIDLILSNSTSAIPNSNAVKYYVDNLNIKSKVLDVAYPIGAVYSTTSTDPATLFGGTWTLIDTTDGVKRYQRNS